MDSTWPANVDVAQLRRRVTATYERVARQPDSGFEFGTGAAYAIDILGYERAAVMALPVSCTARFAGVGNPHRVASIPAGSVVLDHACGAGLDLLLAARQASTVRGGCAIGVDLTPPMLACAASAAREAGLADVVELRHGDFETLPVADASVDVVLSNGVVNLAPNKAAVFSEIVRVLRPGGWLQLADVVVGQDLGAALRSNPNLWTARIGGALTETALLAHVAAAGLTEGRIVERFDCFRATSLAAQWRAGHAVGAVALFARKPRVGRHRSEAEVQSTNTSKPRAHAPPGAAADGLED